MSVVEVRKPPTLRMVNSTEEKSPAEWEELYPDLWMILEVTQEDEWEVYKARLIATAEDDAELINIARSYDQKGTVYMITKGNSKGDQPLVVANA